MRRAGLGLLLLAGCHAFDGAYDRCVFEHRCEDSNGGGTGGGGGGGSAGFGGGGFGGTGGAQGPLRIATPDFPLTLVGTVATSPINVAATGSTALAFTLGPVPPPFSVQSNSCTVAPPNTGCTVTFQFAPDAGDPFDASVDFIVGDDGGVMSVPLVARAVDIGVTPAMFDFGPVPVGQTSERKFFNFYNRGHTVWQSVTFQPTAPLTAHDSSCPGPIAHWDGGNLAPDVCPNSFTVTPQTLGAGQGTVQVGVEFNAPGTTAQTVTKEYAFSFTALPMHALEIVCSSTGDGGTLSVSYDGGPPLFSCDQNSSSLSVVMEGLYRLERTRGAASSMAWDGGWDGGSCPNADVCFVPLTEDTAIEVIFN